MNSIVNDQFPSVDEQLKAGIMAAGDVKHRITNLDGLRGIAIAMVLIHHSANLPWPTECTSTPLFKSYWHIAESLWVGVDIFFVLSGFLITSILIKTRYAKNYFTGFYGRRLLRIFPMFFLVLLAVSIVLLWKSEFQLWQFLVLLFSFGNWLIIGGHEVPVLNHFWSLAVEDQFYLTWPLVLFFFKPRQIVNICFGLIFIAILLRLFLAWGGINAYINYKITPTRWDGLAWGAILACLPTCPKFERWIQSHLKQLQYVAAICLLVVFGIKGGLFGYSNFSISLGMPWVELLSFALVFQTLQIHDNKLNRILNSMPLQWLGRYSYSIYLLHMPCLFIAMYLFCTKQSISKGALMLALSFYLIVSLVLARLAWTLVEEPFLKLRYKFKPQW